MKFYSCTGLSSLTKQEKTGQCCIIAILLFFWGQIKYSKKQLLKIDSIHIAPLTSLDIVFARDIT